MRMEFEEHLAAMSPWATFNVNRRKNAKPIPLSTFVTNRTTRSDAPAERQRLRASSAPVGGSVASQNATTGMRIAKRGERPPSRRAPGTPDQVIERFDAYMATMKGARRG